MFVCLWFILPLENFSLIWRHHPFLLKGCKFWPMLGTLGHWAVKVLQRATPTVTRASVHNGHLRGPVTLARIAKRLAVELSLPVLDLGLLWLGFEHLTFRLRGPRSNPLRHYRDLTVMKNKNKTNVFSRFNRLVISISLCNHSNSLIKFKNRLSLSLSNNSLLIKHLSD